MYTASQNGQVNAVGLTLWSVQIKARDKVEVPAYIGQHFLATCGRLCGDFVLRERRYSKKYGEIRMEGNEAAREERRKYWSGGDVSEPEMKHIPSRLPTMYL